MDGHLDKVLGVRWEDVEAGVHVEHLVEWLSIRRRGSGQAYSLTTGVSAYSAASSGVN